MDNAFTYVAPQQSELRPVEIETPEPGQSVVRTMWSGLSRGTERLVFHGRVPPSEWERMRAPHQGGFFPFPVTYGYAAVGIVEQGPDALVGRHVFALYPHQTRFVLSSDALVPLPAATPPRRAILAANMETALNGLWDAGVGPGDRVAIVGGGVLGGLLAGLCGSIPGVDAALIDIATERAALAADMNVTFALPDEAAARGASEADVVFHTSATEAGLELALSLAGAEARVVELSWFGDRRPAAGFGAAFHSRRLSLISSQVGQVAPSRRPRWSHRRRLAKAIELLADPRYDALITDEVAFEDLPSEIARLLADPSPETGAPGLATAIRYASGADAARYRRSQDVRR